VEAAAGGITPCFDGVIVEVCSVAGPVLRRIVEHLFDGWELRRSAS
jgi:hypothetical protein